MNSVGAKERATQHRVVKLFTQQLDYDYLSDWQERTDNSCIETDYLLPFLKKQGYSEQLIRLDQENTLAMGASFTTPTKPFATKSNIVKPCAPKLKWPVAITLT